MCDPSKKRGIATGKEQKTTDNDQTDNDSTDEYKPYDAKGHFQRPSSFQQLVAVRSSSRVESRLPLGTPASDLAIFAKLFPTHSPIPLPKSGDWLAEHKEEPQDLATFGRSMYNRVTTQRKTIYILPLGDFDPNVSPSLEALRVFAEAFFSMCVILLPTVVSIPGKTKDRIYFAAQDNHVAVTSRINTFSKKPQLLTSDLVNVMSRYLPRDAYCMLGITMTDLYPSESWNFVFGEASMRNRMGVFSFARYSPLFERKKAFVLSDEEKVVLTRRSCRVMVHELFHMFGIGHCVFASCCMNGSNSLSESDTQPLFLCPVDLAKLFLVHPFKLVSQLDALRSACQLNGFEQDIRLLDCHLAHVHSLTAESDSQKDEPANKKKQRAK